MARIGTTGAGTGSLAFGGEDAVRESVLKVDVCKRDYHYKVNISHNL